MPARTLPALPLLLAALAQAQAAPAPPETLVDHTWHGELHAGGETKHIQLGFEDYRKGDKHATVMYLDVPEMKFLHYGPIPVRAAAAGYTAGYFHFSLSESDKRLSGGWTFDGNDLPLDLTSGALPPIAPPAVDLGPGASPAWSFKAGGPIWSSPAVADGHVYFGSDDGLVYALSTDSGRELWRFKTGGPVKAAPALDHDALYVISDDGILYRLDAATGKPRWRFDTHGGGVPRDMPSLTSARYDYQASGPVVADGVVYVGSADKRLYAVDTASGRERWHFDTRDIVRSTPALADGRVYFGSYDHYVYVLDARDGRLVWKHDTLEPVVSTPLVSGGRVFIGSRDSNLFALDAGDGRVLWKFFYWSSWVESSARLQDGVLYIGSSDYQQLFALDPASGRELWRFNTDGSPWYAPAVDAETVYIGAVGTPGYFIDHHGDFVAVDRKNGKARWHYAFPPNATFTFGVGNTPALACGKVFFGGLDGTFYAFPAGPAAPAGRGKRPVAIE